MIFFDQQKKIIWLEETLYETPNFLKRNTSSLIIIVSITEGNDNLQLSKFLPLLTWLDIKQ